LRVPTSLTGGSQLACSSSDVLLLMGQIRLNKIFPEPLPRNVNPCNHFYYYLCVYYAPLTAHPSFPTIPCIAALLAIPIDVSTSLRHAQAFVIIFYTNEPIDIHNLRFFNSQPSKSASEDVDPTYHSAIQFYSPNSNDVTTCFTQKGLPRQFYPAPGEFGSY
jgi:hypothetical protein